MSTTHTADHRVVAVLNDGTLTDVQKVQKIREIITEINPKDCDPNKVYRVRLTGSPEEYPGWRPVEGGASYMNRWCVKYRDTGMRWCQDEEITVLGPMIPEKKFFPGQRFDSLRAIIDAGVPEGTRFVDKDGDRGTLTRCAPSTDRDSIDGWTFEGIAGWRDTYAPFEITSTVVE